MKLSMPASIRRIVRARSTQAALGGLFAFFLLLHLIGANLAHTTAKPQEQIQPTRMTMRLKVDPPPVKELKKEPPKKEKKAEAPKPKKEAGKPEAKKVEIVEAKAEAPRNQSRKSHDNKGEPGPGQAKSRPRGTEAGRNKGARPIVVDVRTSATVKIAHGRGLLSAVRDGTFPQLSLDYPDPVEWIQFLYGIGAVTLVYDEVGGKLYALDLIRGGMRQIDKTEIAGCSQIMHVIDDATWNRNRREAAQRIGLNPAGVKIFALLPVDVESRWVGHQAAVFRSLDLEMSKVAAVDARVGEDRVFRVQSVHTSDGRTLLVEDREGA